MIKEDRNDTLDALKGFSILLVMIGHCIVLNHLEEGVIYDAIKAVQMPLFMMISGYLAGKTLVIYSGKELRNKVKKRAVAYLVPFVSWIFVTNVTTFWTTFKSVLFQLDRGLWFLMVLFSLSVILYVAVYLKDCRKWGVWGFIITYAIVISLLVFQILRGNTFLGPHLTINYLPFHLLGYFVGKYLKWDKVGKKINLFVLPAAFLFVYLVLRYDMVVARSRLEWLIQLLASLLGSITCIYFMARLRDGKVKKALNIIGLYTLEIYVLHFRFATILGFSDKGIHLYSMKGVLYILAAFAVMSLFTAFFIFMLKQLKITDFLLFGKSIKH